ncbi:Hypothetical predicted protein [Cloeon dipterum]|uniref:Reverse transcriptase domain-containing protein n=2 Tax=Cloeon dipterum TaxID=197152 RepID=A0A8S1CX23_9INSE|nr:Hypothetical predicted protein [Cloeon dipterum]
MFTCRSRLPFLTDADWLQNPPRAGQAPAAEFLGTFSELALQQLVQNATRTTDTTAKILDLALCDAPAFVASVTIVPGTSDHDAILLDFAVTQRATTTVREIFDFKNADWPAVSQHLEEKFAECTFEGENVDRGWEKWLRIFWDALAEAVPKKRVRPGKRNSTPWITKELRAEMNKRDRLFERWQKQKSQSRREEFLVARRKVQKVLRTARDGWMWKLGRGPGGNKFFWDFIKSKSKISPSAGVFQVNGVNISEPEQVAAAFSEMFSANFNSVKNYFPFMRRRPPGPPPPTLCDMSVSAACVYSKLKQIKGNATAGPDGVQGCVLLKCAAALAPSLARLFNCSLQQCSLPAGWKTAAVVPIPKTGKKSLLENYRPISMKKIGGKSARENCARQNSTLPGGNKIIPDCQHGFRQKRSCTTLLCKMLDKWAAIVDQKPGAHIHAVTLDWKKAFDRVPHDRLLSKLSYYGVQGNILRWTGSFLQGRNQYVVYNGAKSELREVCSGVVQGSVLGPLLFTIYVPAAVKAQIAQYADDVTLWKQIGSAEDAGELQDDLDAVFAWCESNGMELNAAKCHVMDVTRAKNALHTPYTVGGSVLEYNDTERILGVHVSNDLRWNKHTDIARGKAAKVLSFAARNLYGCTPRVKRLAYLTMVKPLMFYGTPTWHPSTQCNIQKFERVQNRALRFVHGRNVSEKARKELLTVHQQFSLNDMTFFRKCLDGETDMDAMERILVGRTMRNADGEHRLIPPRARTDLGVHSFSFRIVQQWNSLPSAIFFFLSIYLF